MGSVGLFLLDTRSERDVLRGSSIGLMLSG